MTKKQARQRLAMARARRRQLGLYLGGGAAAAAVIGLSLFYRPSGASSAFLRGEAVPLQSTTHIQVGEGHSPYNSMPPTSGWHYAQPAAWGIRTTPISDETQVHNLEHGGILVQYRPDLDANLVERLRQLVGRYRSKVILAPYPALSADVSLTAWGRIDTFAKEESDERRVEAFIDAYRNRGPEFVPD